MAPVNFTLNRGAPERLSKGALTEPWSIQRTYQAHCVTMFAFNATSRATRASRGPASIQSIFGPGSYLDSVVAVFSVPLSLKGGSFAALSQAHQIQMSRCRLPGGRALNC